MHFKNKHACLYVSMTNTLKSSNKITKMLHFIVRLFCNRAGPAQMFLLGLTFSQDTERHQYLFIITSLHSLLMEGKCNTVTDSINIASGLMPAER